MTPLLAYFYRFIDNFLQRENASPAIEGIGGDDIARSRCDGSFCYGQGAETAVYDTMSCPKSLNCKHVYKQLRHHRHVYGNDFASFHSQLFS